MSNSVWIFLPWIYGCFLSLESLLACAVSHAKDFHSLVQGVPLLKEVSMKQQPSPSVPWTCIHFGFSQVSYITVVVLYFWFYFACFPWMDPASTCRGCLMDIQKYFGNNILPKYLVELLLEFSWCLWFQGYPSPHVLWHMSESQPAFSTPLGFLPLFKDVITEL